MSINKHALELLARLAGQPSDVILNILTPVVRQFVADTDNHHVGRPRPEKLYAPERAKKEAADLHERALRNGMPPSGRWA